MKKRKHLSKKLIATIRSATTRSTVKYAIGGRTKARDYRPVTLSKHETSSST